MKDERKWDGIDQLRTAVRLFDNCNESFNQQFTVQELLTLWRAYRDCGWYIPPNVWTPRQVREALGGKAPKWQPRDERPAYDPAPLTSTYQLVTDEDETRLTAAQFFEDNAADDELRAAILALDVDECFEDGGGASPEWSLTRLT